MATKPKQDAPSGFEVPEGWASVLFDKAFALSETYEQVVKERKANRESLRSLAAQGLLSEEEAETLAELYPERPRKSDETAADAPAAAPVAA